MPYPQCLDLGAVVTGMENMALSTNGVPASVLTTIPNVAASKILAFGQSSQVHPVIAIEVITSSDRHSYSSFSSTVAKSSSDAAAHQDAQYTQFLKPITSLLILASGRECTAVEIVSTPDPDG